MRNIKPIHYRIHLEPDLDSFRVEGTVEIDIVADEKISEVMLNAHNLAIWGCELKKGDIYAPLSFRLEPSEQALIIALPKPGEEKFSVRIRYVAQINNTLLGFYRSRYQVNDEEKYLGVTQFEETYARQAFPCFDHPSKKATFDIEFVIDDKLKAIANTIVKEEKHLEDGRKLVKFETTPVMATYLLFFGVGDFEIREDASGRVVQRIITTPGKTRYGDFALEFSKKVLKFGEEYTGVPYPLKKMDQIAIPDFAFGAMENYGAITYRENLLLVYPGITSAASMERIAEVIAHEWAHQWFGNLVTPMDWKYIWLNESFATLFGYAITDHYYPEWRIWDQFLANETKNAQERDALIETFPIELPGKGEQIKINEATSPIIYNKGGSVLQMIRGYLGGEQFREGIHHFLTKHIYGNASSNDYWAAFEEITDTPISKMMETWIHQPGYPVIRASTKNGKLSIEQHRFTFLPHESTQLWIIPLTIRYFTKDGKTREQRLLLKDRMTELTPPENVSAFKLNVDQTGFYRVQYETDNLTGLGKLVANKALTPQDRFGIQNDFYAFVRNGVYSLDDYLKFLEHYVNEDAYLPLYDIAGNLLHIHTVVPAKRKATETLGRRIFSKVLAKIGYEPRPDDLHTTSILRSSLLWANYRFGDPDIAAFGLSKFDELRKGGKVHPDILLTIMRIGAASRPEAFDWFKKRLESPSTSEQERINILVALGSFGNKDTILDAMDYALEKVPKANRFIPIIYAIRNHVMAGEIWQWYIDNLRRLERLHSTHYERIIMDVVALGGLDRESEVSKFFAEYMQEKAIAQDTIKMALEKLRINSRLRNQ
ncbi:MAG: M1 family metallopeptidase [Candidatus Ranarchaeia archaeon]